MTGAVIVIILKALGAAIYPIFEYFIGKTAYGSLVGMILAAILKVLDALGLKPVSKEEGKKDA